MHTYTMEYVSLHFVSLEPWKTVELHVWRKETLMRYIADDSYVPMDISCHIKFNSIGVAPMGTYHFSLTLMQTYKFTEGFCLKNLRLWSQLALAVFRWSLFI